MRRLVSIIVVLSLLLALTFAQNSNIGDVEASPDVHQGDLVLTDSDVYVIENQRFDINGSIIIEENATLILGNAFLNFTAGPGHGIYIQNPSNGNPRLMAQNTTTIGMQTSRFHGNGSVLFSNCSISGPGALHLYDESNVTIIDSRIEKTLQARDSSRVTIFDSTIELLGLTMKSANSSISKLSAGFFHFWDFWLNCSVVLNPSGRAPNVTLNRTTILEWSFSFQGSSNSEMFSSKIWLLHANEDAHVSLHNSTMNEIEIYGTSVIELTNSTHQLRKFSNEAKVYVSWYLFVHVVDSLSQNVPSANVTITFPDSTLNESKLSDDNGWARFTLLEKMMNATGEYPVGTYTVEASYEMYSNSTAVDMATNQIATLALSELLIAPWDITGPTMWVPDGKCDIRDVALVAKLFGSVEGDGRYDVRADITGPTYLVSDGKIDMRDVALVAKHYGEVYG